MTTKEITAIKRRLIERFIDKPIWAREMKIAARLFSLFEGREEILDNLIPQAKIDSLTYFWTAEGKKLIRETAKRVVSKAQESQH